MKYHFLSLILLALAASLMIGCNESSNIGNSLADEDLSIVVDSNFTVTGRTVANPTVASRTISQLIGALEAPGYGNITSDFVAQFMPSLTIDTVGVRASDIDSVKLFMQMQRGDFTGDSLVPMGLEVYPLTRDLPYPIYSDFDPSGYYDAANPLASIVYTASSKDEPDSIKELSAIVLSQKLPLQLGRDIFNAYMANPAIFANPSQFAEKVFKGIYVKSTYGAGRISDFTTTSIRYYYHKEEYNEDSARYETVRYVGDYLAVAPEVIVNNNIRYQQAPELAQMVAAGENLIVAPTGMEVEFRFPAPEIIASFDRYGKDLRVLNTLTFSIPADSIANDFQIGPPPYVLMVLKNKKEEFFADNSINDNLTSFYASYDSTNDCYNFNSMRAYILDLIDKGEITEDDYTFSLVPVQVNMELSAGSSAYNPTYVVSSIVPYVSKPVMTKISLDKAKIKLTFSAQKQ